MNPEHLTAYALHELSAEETAAMQDSLAQSAELTAQAAELASFCSLLTENLGSSEVGLTTEQRLRLTETATVAVDPEKVTPITHTANTRPAWNKKPAPFWKQPPVWITTAAAAAVVLVGLNIKITIPEKSPAGGEVVAYGNSESVSVKLREKGKEIELAEALKPGFPRTRLSSPPSSESRLTMPEERLDSFGTSGAGGGFGDTLTKNGTGMLGGSPAPSGNVALSRSPTAPLFPSAGKAPSPNGFLQPKSDPLSTFSADVDTAAYAMVRRCLNAGVDPSIKLIRLEELVNYFPYSYPEASQGQPFSVSVEVTEAPWAPLHRLARIGIKARADSTPVGATNYVFLVDVSGSMAGPDRLGLVQQSLAMLVEKLHPADRVALVSYAGSTRVVLPSTAVEDKQALTAAIAELSSGGSTAGSSGIQLAYEEAKKGFVKGGVNRVVLCTDGDFNVGITDSAELERFITEQARSGVFLSVLGYGVGNTQDQRMELLADKGNGNYAYIDSLSEARKVLVDQRDGTLVTVAKDVKFQVEFNPFQVQSYRLLGYENRMLEAQDFNNDAKDAGEVGAGHTVTALYEIVPLGVIQADDSPLVDDLKYQKRPSMNETAKAPEKVLVPSDELFTVKVRYKAPEADASQKLEVPVKDTKLRLTQCSPDTRWATAVAAFSMKLRGQVQEGTMSWEAVRQLALSGKGADPLGYRGEFLSLVDKARSLQK